MSSGRRDCSLKSAGIPGEGRPPGKKSLAAGLISLPNQPQTRLFWLYWDSVYHKSRRLSASKRLFLSFHSIFSRRGGSPAGKPSGGRATAWDVSKIRVKRPEDFADSETALERFCQDVIRYIKTDRDEESAKERSSARAPGGSICRKSLQF